MTFSQDPNYWDNLATSELVNSSTKSEKLRIKYENIYNLLLFSFNCNLNFF